MTTDDIAHSIEEFGKAAFNAKNAEFDTVIVDASQGYLLSQFLNGEINHRGTLENRARIVRNIARKVRTSDVADDSTQVGKWLAEDGVELFACMNSDDKEIPEVVRAQNHGKKLFVVPTQ